MVEIADIEDVDSLQAWLKALPQDTPKDKARAREIAVTLAARAAARVLPIWWAYVLGEKDARDHDLTALPGLRAILTSEVAGLVNTPDVRRAARAAADDKAARTYEVSFALASAGASNLAGAADASVSAVEASSHDAARASA